MNPARIRAYLALAVSALIWGAAQPLIKPALHLISPLQYMGLRYLVATPIALIVIVILIFRCKKTLKLKDVLKIIAIETTTLLNLLLLYTGLRLTTALQSALILDARPVFITAMGILFLREREETHEWIGLILSLTGICLVVSSPFLTTGTIAVSPTAALGNILIVLTNIIAMGNTYLVKRTYKHYSKILISAINVLYGTVFFTLINLATTHDLALPSLSNPTVLLPVVYMAVFGTMLALSLQLYGYNKIESSEAVLFQYLEPLVFVPLAVFWLKEPVSAFQFVGLAAILVGVILAAMRLPRHHRGKPLSHGQALSGRIRLAESPIITHYQRFR